MDRKTVTVSAVLFFGIAFVSGQGKIVVSVGSVEKTGEDPKVFLPIQLQGGQSPIGKIVGELQFPNQGIELTAVEASEGVRLVDGQASFEKVSAAEAGVSKVKVTVTGKKPLPDGTLAQLVFNVEPNPDRPDDEIITIELKALAYDASNKEVGPVSSQSGEISFAPPIFGCFFYMH